MAGLASASAPPAVHDRLGRALRDLRISVTDRCNFRCVYCMPAIGMKFQPRDELLTDDELLRVIDLCGGLGFTKLRLTGGEPTVRPHLVDLVRGMKSVAGIEQLSMTTNGLLLGRIAGDLKAAGLDRVNVSIDTLDPVKFKTITRWGDLSTVLKGVEAAKRAGIGVKINAVALKGVNEDELDHMVAWCGAEGFDLTLIETMPLGEIDADRTAQYLPLSVVRARLAERWTLTDIPYRTGGPARYVEVAETGGRLGFITPLTHNFCEACNRVRVTCTGTMFMCLGQEDAVDLRGPLRASEGDEAVTEAIRAGIARKPKGHDFVIDRRHNRPAVGRHMSVTGG